MPPDRNKDKIETWPDLFRRPAKGEATLLINVVSYGYATTDMDYKLHPFFTDGMSKEEFQQCFLKQNREMELRALKKLRPNIENTPGSLKMITLVTKQDLWWNDRYDAEKHYTEGPYQIEIEKTFAAKGTSNFSHDYRSISLKHLNLRSKDGQLLFPVTEGYDVQIKQPNEDLLVRTVLEYLESSS